MKSLVNLVGMSHRPNGDAVVQEIPTDSNLLLVREPSNPYDPNAIQVFAHIGYIKASQAKALAPRIDAAADPVMSWSATLSRKTSRNWIELEIEEPQPAPSMKGDSDAKD